MEFVPRALGSWEPFVGRIWASNSWVWALSYLQLMVVDNWGEFLGQLESGDEFRRCGLLTRRRAVAEAEPKLNSRFELDERHVAQSIDSGRAASAIDALRAHAEHVKDVGHVLQHAADYAQWALEVLQRELELCRAAERILVAPPQPPSS
jgi:hypothetical protein